MNVYIVSYNSDSKRNALGTKLLSINQIEIKKKNRKIYDPKTDFNNGVLAIKFKFK